MNMKPDIKITNLVPDTNFKLLISGLMAIILWSGTATVIGFHLGVVIQLSNKISGVQPGTQSSKEEVDNIQKGITSVDSTAKSLYSFLTPFAAAVTGFFFNEVTSAKREEKKSDTSKDEDKNTSGGSG
ncbi:MULTISPECIES: hypothetical protein [Microcystis]|jgi:hypothetical protein|nr:MULTISPECIES: hypothetical protein [Microcystis]MCZ8240619.1 hypothetical protein [Microcystis sp. LE19-131.1A]TRT92946.1 MAG: hypothetical protein EWV62_20490 [Microcystis aeruginosa Ma_OC_LR_19540900_S633]TYT72764.1 hypothetical protein FXO09_02035 [Microcystis aeruginosa KLA2]